MTPSNEQDVIHALQMTCASLTNNNPGLSAYPHLHSVFYQLAINLETMVKTLLNSQRDELLFGKTPAAKLFKLQTGQSHALPKGVLDSPAPVHWQGSADRPLRAILEYAKCVRHSVIDTIKGTVEHVIEPATATTPAVTQTTYTSIDIETNEALIHWFGCAVKVRLPSFDFTQAFAEGPLFHEPIELEAGRVFLNEALWEPLYMTLVGVEHIDVTDPKYLLMDRYFGTKETPVEVPDDHPLLQLRQLVNTSMYGVGQHYFAAVEWKHYIVDFRAERDWDYHESLLLTVSVHERNENTTGEVTRGQVTHNWWKNPLLVNDLLADMDSLIDQALTRHEAQTQSQ